MSWLSDLFQKGTDFVSDVYHQVNPFDAGQTFESERQARKVRLQQEAEHKALLKQAALTDLNDIESSYDSQSPFSARQETLTPNRELPQYLSKPYRDKYAQKSQGDFKNRDYLKTFTETYFGTNPATANLLWTKESGYGLSKSQSVDLNPGSLEALKDNFNNLTRFQKDKFIQTLSEMANNGHRDAALTLASLQQSGALKATATEQALGLTEGIGAGLTGGGAKTLEGIGVLPDQARGAIRASEEFSETNPLLGGDITKEIGKAGGEIGLDIALITGGGQGLKFAAKGTKFARTARITGETVTSVGVNVAKTGKGDVGLEVGIGAAEGLAPSAFRGIKKLFSRFKGSDKALKQADDVTTRAKEAEQTRLASKETASKSGDVSDARIELRDAVRKADDGFHSSQIEDIESIDDLNRVWDQLDDADLSSQVKPQLQKLESTLMKTGAKDVEILTNAKVRKFAEDEFDKLKGGGIYDAYKAGEVTYEEAIHRNIVANIRHKLDSYEDLLPPRGSSNRAERYETLKTVVNKEINQALSDGVIDIPTISKRVDSALQKEGFEEIVKIAPSKAKTIKEFEATKAVKDEADAVVQTQKKVGVPTEPSRTVSKAVKEADPDDPILLGKKERKIIEPINNSNLKVDSPAYDDVVKEYQTKLNPSQQLNSLYATVKFGDLTPSEMTKFKTLAKKGYQNAGNRVAENAFLDLKDLVGSRTVSYRNKELTGAFLGKMGRYYDGMVKQTKVSGSAKDLKQWQELRNTAKSLAQIGVSESGTILHRSQRNQELLFGKNLEKVWEALKDPKLYEKTPIAQQKGRILIKDILEKNILAQADTAKSMAKAGKEGSVALGFKKFIKKDGRSLSKLGEAVVERTAVRMYDVARQLKEVGLTRADGTFDWDALRQLEDAQPYLNKLEVILSEPKIFLDALNPRTGGAKAIRLGNQFIDTTTLNLVGSISTLAKILGSNLVMTRLFRAAHYLGTKSGLLAKTPLRKIIPGVKSLGKVNAKDYTFFDYMRQEAHELSRTLNIKKTASAWFQGFKVGEAQLDVGRSLNVIDLGNTSPFRSKLTRYTVGLTNRLSIANMKAADSLISGAVRYGTETTSARRLFRQAKMSEADIKKHLQTIEDMRIGNPKVALKQQAANKEALDKVIAKASEDVYDLNRAEAQNYLDQWYKSSESAADAVKAMDKDAFGGAAGFLSAVTNKIKVLKLPFVFSKTILNLANLAADITPGTILFKAPLSNKLLVRRLKKQGITKLKLVDEIKANNVRKKAGFQALGLGFLGSGWLMGGKDGLLTGAYPSDPKERAYWERNGIEPFSLKIGDSYMSLEFLAAPLMPFFMGASMRNRWDVISQDSSHEAKKILDVVATGAVMPLQAMAEIPVFTVTKDIQNLITAPEGEDFGKRLYKIGTNMASRVVPGIVKWAARVQDPQLKEPVGFTERVITQYIPYLRKKVGDKKVLGHLITESPYWHSAGIKMKKILKEVDDPVFKEIDTLFDPEISEGYFDTNKITLNDFTLKVGSTHIYDTDGEILETIHSKREVERMNRDLKDSGLDEKAIKELNNNYGTAVYDEISRWIETDDYKNADDVKKRAYLTEIRRTVREAKLRDFKEGTDLELYLNPKASTNVRDYRDPNRQPRYRGGEPKSPSQKLSDARYELQINKDPDKEYDLKKKVALTEVDAKYEDEPDVLEFGSADKGKLVNKLNRVYDEQGAEASRDLFYKIVQYNKDKYNTGYKATKTYFDKYGRPKPPEGWLLYNEIKPPATTSTTSSRRSRSRGASLGSVRGAVHRKLSRSELLAIFTKRR